MRSTWVATGSRWCWIVESERINSDITGWSVFCSRESLPRGQQGRFAQGLLHCSSCLGQGAQHTTPIPSPSAAPLPPLHTISMTMICDHTPHGRVVGIDTQCSKQATRHSSLVSVERLPPYTQLGAPAVQLSERSIPALTLHPVTLLSPPAHSIYCSVHKVPHRTAAAAARDTPAIPPKLALP